jgi:hypothetical protein
VVHELFYILVFPELPIVLHDAVDEAIEGDGVIVIEILFEEVECF